MKKLLLVFVTGIALSFTACKGSKTHQITSTPIADSPGSGAKMIDSPTTSRPDSARN